MTVRELIIKTINDRIRQGAWGGRDLKLLRTMVGLSQAALAVKIGWSHSKVCRIERGYRKTSVEENEALVGALGLADTLEGPYTPLTVKLMLDGEQIAEVTHEPQ